MLPEIPRAESGQIGFRSQSGRLHQVVHHFANRAVADAPELHPVLTENYCRVVETLDRAPRVPRLRLSM